MAHCWDQRDEGQVGEVGETRALRQGNLSPRLDTGPSCRGRVSSLAQAACRIRSFARSLEPCWTRHAGWNCSHCWAPLWGQPQPHCPHSAGSGSSTVSPWLLSHSQEVMLDGSHRVLTDDTDDAHMPVPMLRLAGRLGSLHRCQAGAGPAHQQQQRTSGGRAVSGAAGRRRIGRNQLGGRESWARLSVRHPDPPTSSSSSSCPGLLRPNHLMHAPGTLFSVLTSKQYPSTHPSISDSQALFYFGQS